jgi:uncharacterized protein with NRDE domain
MQGAQQTLAVIFSSMCTIAILLEVVAGAPLVIAANRDEIYARPTRPPESLGDGIAGGVDVLSGGTWLAIRRDGRFAAVTNQRALAPVPPGLRSRGLAVLELATATDADAADAYVAALDPAMYASMNLVWGDARGVSIAYVRRGDPSRADRFRSAAQQGTESPHGEGLPPGGSLEIERLPPGIHVLCNDRLGAEGFPRGVRLHDAIAGAPLRWPELVPVLQTALADHTRLELAAVAQLAASTSIAPGQTASSAVPAPPRLSPELARELTATCIHSPSYGTRSSTIFAARADQTTAYLHADGPPCTTPFTDRTALL